MTSSCCAAVSEARAALDVAGEILAGLGLKLHPDTTEVVDLRKGREGFDVLGCHFRARVSGRLLERGICRYYLHRWPSARALKSIGVKIKVRTGRRRVGINDIRELIAELNPILHGWGNDLRTGNAAEKFRQIDRYVAWRLKRLLDTRTGRNLRAAEAAAWTEDWFVGLGLHRLLGTIRCPGAA